VIGLIPFKGISFADGLCNTKLLSFSKANICEDDICQYSSIINLDISAKNGDSTCFTFQTSKENSNVNAEDVELTFNMTTFNNYISYSLSRCYNTSDIKFYQRVYCGCRGAHDTAITCQSQTCLNNIKYNSSKTVNSVCISGVSQNSKGCAGMALGYCAKIIATEVERYVICDLVNPVLTSRITVNYNGQATSYFVSLNSDHIITSQNYNITLIKNSDAINEIGIDNRIMFDKANPNGFYIVNKQEINGDNEYSNLKLGWAKTDNIVDTLNQVKNNFDMIINNCGNDNGTFIPNLLDTNAYLYTNPNLL